MFYSFFFLCIARGTRYKPKILKDIEHSTPEQVITIMIPTDFPFVVSTHSCRIEDKHSLHFWFILAYPIFPQQVFLQKSWNRGKFLFNLTNFRRFLTFIPLYNILLIVFLFFYAHLSFFFAFILNENKKLLFLSFLNSNRDYLFFGFNDFTALFFFWSLKKKKKEER